MALNLKFMSYLKPKWKEYCNYVKCNTYIQHLSHDIPYKGCFVNILFMRL